MKNFEHLLQLAALLAAVADAQTSTIINDPLDQAVTTVYFSVCPTAATTTVTLPSTVTFCPGDGCNGGGPTITAPPNPHDAAHTSTVLEITITGADGKVTELNEYLTVYDAPCTKGPGMCQATYTITEECPCHTRNPEVLPTGFTTSVHVCNACGPKNGPMTMTQTLPCSTGPYASVTPTMGPSPPAGGAGAGAGASAGAAASAGANAAAGSNGGNAAAGSNGSAGSNAAAGSNGSGNNAAANANAAAGASAGAVSNGGSGSAPGSAGANSSGAGSAGAAAGAGGAAPGAMGGNGAAPGGMGGSGGSGNMDVGAAAGNGTSPPMSAYTGAADKAAFAFTTLFAAAVGCLAWML